jgi:hypothetical protein
MVIVVVVLPVPEASARMPPCDLPRLQPVKVEVIQVLDAQPTGLLAKHASETILRSLLENLGLCVSAASSAEYLLNVLPGPLASGDRVSVPLTGG